MAKRPHRTRFCGLALVSIVAFLFCWLVVPLRAQSGESSLSSTGDGEELTKNSEENEPSAEVWNRWAQLRLCAADRIRGAPDFFDTAPRLTFSTATASPSHALLTPRHWNPADNSTPSSTSRIQRSQPPVSPNQNSYYKNRLEFSLDGGWLPINIPFVFDVFLGDSYNMTSLKYTLVPLIASLRWQMGNVAGPWIFRGNWELETSGAVTLIPRGPETRYFAWIMGIRRNFVPHRGRIAPYFDGRLGLGDINAKEPAGVLYAQGQDFTFTVNMGSGVRYNINPRYSFTAGLNWMHISNLYLSEPKFLNYGINVYGPMFGIDVLLGKPRSRSSQ
ncbi:MAG TPA: acyloxyacyl hydrolase [Candidatus Sulfotelmatobacter sp.]|nr:acyloxyacyl hydrolase [Candidatus Sulfotelmatobacter sp.]